MIILHLSCHLFVCCHHLWCESLTAILCTAPGSHITCQSVWVLLCRLFLSRLMKILSGLQLLQIYFGLYWTNGKHESLHCMCLRGLVTDVRDCQIAFYKGGYIIWFLRRRVACGHFALWDITFQMKQWLTFIEEISSNEERDKCLVGTKLDAFPWKLAKKFEMHCQPT